MDTVELGGKHLPVILPESFVARAELVMLMMAGKRNPYRVYSAVVGSCVPALKLGITPRDHEYDMLAYGGAVADVLQSRGILYADVCGAFVVIAPLLNDDLMPEEEVAEVVVFTKSEEEPTPSP